MKYRRKTIHIIIFTILALALGLVLGGCSRGDARTHRTGLFSRDSDVLEFTHREELFKEMDERGIKELYQYFPPGTDSRKITQFINKAESHGISVWMLAGEPEWEMDYEGELLSDQVVRAVIFGGMQGIVIDMEPQLSSVWEEDPAKGMQTFVNAMKRGYKSASEAGLEWVVCVPDDFDQYPEFTTLVKEYADAIAVMDYDKSDEGADIDAEAALCAKYGRSLIYAYDRRDPSQYNLEPGHNYYGEDPDALRAAWDKLQAALSEKYPRLTFSCAFME